MKSRKTMLIAVVATAALLSLGALLVGCGQGGSAASVSSASSAASGSSAASTAAPGSSAAADGLFQVDPDDPYASGTHHAVLTVEGYDPVTIELDADSAPATVANFCKLAGDGYYDGKTFYRFVEGFVVQGGTLGNNAAGQDPSVPNVLGEFAANGVDNPLADDFGRGTVAMARSIADMNSASTTFFVTLDSSEGVAQSLNGQYGAFGTIDEAGMKVVDQMVADYLPKVSDATMGAIDSEADQAKIVSIEITD